MVAETKREIRKFPTDAKNDLYEALQKYGADLDAYARIISMFITGLRPHVSADGVQAARDISDDLKPKILEVNGETVVRIDSRTQMQALRLYAEILGLKETGVKVNVNTGNQINGIRDAESLGEIFLAANEGADKRLKDAVRALPPEQRRLLASAMKDDIREVIEVPAVAGAEEGEESDGVS